MFLCEQTTLLYLLNDTMQMNHTLTSTQTVVQQSLVLRGCLPGESDYCLLICSPEKKPEQVLVCNLTDVLRKAASLILKLQQEVSNQIYLLFSLFTASTVETAYKSAAAKTYAFTQRMLDSSRSYLHKLKVWKLVIILEFVVGSLLKSAILPSEFIREVARNRSNGFGWMGNCSIIAVASLVMAIVNVFSATSRETEYFLH